MNPYPFVGLNHLTVPVAIFVSVNKTDTMTNLYEDHATAFGRRGRRSNSKAVGVVGNRRLCLIAHDDAGLSKKNYSTVWACRTGGEKFTFCVSPGVLHLARDAPVRPKKDSTRLTQVERGPSAQGAPPKSHALAAGPPCRWHW
jgi:hypothetical protein